MVLAQAHVTTVINLLILIINAKIVLTIALPASSLLTGALHALKVFNFLIINVRILLIPHVLRHITIITQTRLAKHVQ